MTGDLTSDEQRALLRLTAGRARASEQAPYFSSALFAMQPVDTPGLGTFAVDRQWRLYWDPEFCASMTVEEGAAVWLHEVGHLLREHADRFDALLEPDERRGSWNQAADAAINADLRDAGIALPPVAASVPERIAGATRDMGTEQMYRLLLRSPGGTPATAATPGLVLLPARLGHDHGAGTTLSARTRERVITDGTAVTLLDEVGRRLPDAVVTERVRNRRSVTLRLTGRLAPGRYTVVLGGGADALAAGLTVTAPQLRLRPDHVRPGYRAPARLVVESPDLRVDEHTAVELLDVVGGPLPGALGQPEQVSDAVLAVGLGQVPDGVYQVRVTAGAHAAVAVLPVGLPYLDVEPAELPSGFTAPWPLAAVAEDVPVDATTTVTLHDGSGPVDGALTAPAVTSPASLTVALRRSLPDGRYAVVLTTGDVEAAAVLTVGGDAAAEDGETSVGRPADGGGAGGSGSGDGPQDGTADPDSAPDDAADDEVGGHDCGSGAGGRRRPWDLDGEDGADGSVSGGRAEQIRQDVAREIREHATDPAAQGSMAAGWLRWAEARLHPQVDWREELNAVVRRTAAAVAGRRDYTYARPSRRASAVPGVVLPAMRAPRPPRCCVVLDTSGSMGDDLLARCLAEIDAIIARVRGDAVEVIACDASAADAQAVRAVQQLHLVGGGGTDLRVGLAAAAARRPRADLVVTLTDGATPWPAEPPELNRHARYVAVLVADPGQPPPDWMHAIPVGPAR
ncbi:hypothetical protein GB931_14435 [Modestobacter sp. I12A-02628]|uniref:Metal-dependent peptidase n=1 Tax=Goekera deserti TaxID=2497753 RepID=A0A7K3WHX8_9ACTN|nr:VWA-like domain-containing protein [Goekera deserti]MPQ99097.1 hypothetical protein [Goekera deserti]NDI47431.1 hypothetical protein [Goekera deserti]NEL55962.1 hypothetical protein [Goekera deserti]